MEKSNRIQYHELGVILNFETKIHKFHRLVAYPKIQETKPTKKLWTQMIKKCVSCFQNQSERLWKNSKADPRPHTSSNQSNDHFKPSVLKCTQKSHSHTSIPKDYFKWYDYYGKGGEGKMFETLSINRQTRNRLKTVGSKLGLTILDAWEGGEWGCSKMVGMRICSVLLITSI